MPTPVFDAHYEATGYREISNANLASAVAFDDATRVIDPADATKTGAPDGSFYAVLQADGGRVRYRTDGTAPTAAQGMFLDSGSAVAVPMGGGWEKVKAISSSGTPKLLIDFYKLRGT